MTEQAKKWNDAREFATRPLDRNEESQASATRISPAGNSIAIHCNGHVILIPSAKSSGTGSTTSSSPSNNTAPDYVIVGAHDSLCQVMPALDHHHADVTIVSRNPESKDMADIVDVITMKQLLTALGSSWKLLG